MDGTLFSSINWGLAAGGLLCTLASILFYLSAPNQRVRAAPLPRAIGMTAGVVTLVFGAILLLRQMGSGAAMFTLFTIIMLMLTALPLIALLNPQAREGGRRRG